MNPHFPTFYSSRLRGTNPDIILTNYRTYHNIHINQVPIITSDHIPIIINMSTTPILTPTNPRWDLNKTPGKKYPTI